MTDRLIDLVADYLGYTKVEAILLSKKAPKTYRMYKIPKKKTGLRTIHHPSKLTKSLQYALIEILLKELPVHDSAFAYRRNIKSPLLKNAELHAVYPYSVKVDFCDFFHSISSNDLLKRIHDCGIKLSSSDNEFMEDCLFIRGQGGQKQLAIGAPSSPIISNIVMYDLDESIKRLANRISHRSPYSRYADDIVFSTNIRKACWVFYDALCELLDATESPNVRINEKKTVFASRASRRVITGLFIKPDGGVSLGRRNKRYIRKLIFDLKNNTIQPTDLAYLSGYLAFSLDVEPDFYNRLALKYGGEILDQALNPQ